jgi:hypothetical protein
MTDGQKQIAQKLEFLLKHISYCWLLKWVAAEKVLFEFMFLAYLFKPKSFRTIFEINLTDYLLMSQQKWYWMES